MDPTPLEEYLPASSHDQVRSLCTIVEEVALEFGADHIDSFNRLYRAIEQSRNVVG